MKYYILTLTFSSLLLCSTEVKQKEKSGLATKKPKLDPTGEPGTSGVSSTRKTRKFKGKDQRKLHFKLINYPVA